jgi:very-short-patch-repair endonuclease
LAGLAERQHGVVARWQLLDLGISRRAIDTRLASNRLHRLHRGVYAVGHTVLSNRARWIAAVLAAGPGAVLSHRSAAQLWGLLPESTIAPEVTRPGYFRPRSEINAHHSPLLPDELTRLDGIPITSLSRTLFDLASVGSRRQVEKAFNEAEVRGLTDKLSVADLLERYPGRSGSVVLRAILAEEEQARGVTREELEERFTALLARTDLPRPRRNAPIAVGGRFFEVDCLWAEQRLMVELDGRAAHGTDRAFERDREKDRLLLVDGWRVVRITWRQLLNDAPAVVADLRELLRE